MGLEAAPRVSIIVPVRNDLANVLVLVEALSRQTVEAGSFELIVADDGSTDGLSDRLAERGEPWIHVTRSDEPRNAYSARNQAVALARGSVLAFCDADCVPEPEWLERGLTALERDDVIAGRIRFSTPKRRTVWSLLDIDSYKDHERQVRNGTAETANLFVARALFESVGGFEELLPAFSDFEFVQRCRESGASLAFAPDAIVSHPTRDDGRAFLRTQWAYSYSFGEHEGREGRVPRDLRLRALTPIIPVIRTRRWWGRSLGPDRRWLAQNDIAPTTMETLKALPIMYLLLPYLRATAQFAGWLRGVRSRRRDSRSGSGAEVVA